MTVKDLLKELKKYPQDMAVNTRNHQGYTIPMVPSCIVLVEWPGRVELTVGR